MKLPDIFNFTIETLTEQLNQTNATEFIRDCFIVIQFEVEKVSEFLQDYIRTTPHNYLF
jgi:hypothetical protein